MSCLLCAHTEWRPSWVGSTRYRGREYEYRRCLGCGSLYAHPMPDAETLKLMYGPDYDRFLSAQESMSGESEIIRWLRLNKSGTLIDYGCGAGHLLREATKEGWKAVGVELDQRVADKYGTGGEVLIVTDPAKLGNGNKADVLHLGDVIEHLTDPDAQIPRILGLLKKGGTLLAQGPLEANPTLFLMAARWARLLRGRRVFEAPPYHVIQATAQGQREFFRRFHLTELEFSISEVSWPARDSLAMGDFLNPRAVALFFVRRLSQFVSGLRPGALGNRYFYAGRWDG
jgi:SAM-dependent methyltransferase